MKWKRRRSHAAARGHAKPKPPPPAARAGFSADDWTRALAGFAPAPDRSNRAGGVRHFDGWWEQAFKDRPTKSEEQGHACGEDEMLMIVAYDISSPERWRHIAKHCEDYGVRVQYSVFECRLQAEEFDRFWEELRDLIDPTADRLVSYRICCRCARDVRTAGVQEVTSDAKPVAYVF